MDFISLLFYFIVIIPSAIIHEYAHGWIAYQLGDPTAKYAGRLTIDPRAHIDRWGTILMPIGLFILTGGRFMFAYAKPVPYNPYNLRDQKWGPVWVGLAGPMANFMLALCFSIVYHVVPVSPASEFFAIIVMANIVLMVFNLVPIPPLDGSKLLYALLPDSAHQIRAFFDRYGFVLLLFFIFFLFDLIQPIITALVSWLLG